MLTTTNIYFLCFEIFYCELVLETFVAKEFVFLLEAYTVDKLLDYVLAFKPYVKMLDFSFNFCILPRSLCLKNVNGCKCKGTSF